MKLSPLILCDHATVREGLLHVLGGGVNVIHRPVYPAQLGLTLAALLEFSATEMSRPHKILVQVRAEDGETIAEVEATTDGRIASMQFADIPGFAPLVFDLGGLLIPSPGPWVVGVSIDGGTEQIVRIRAAVLDVGQAEAEVGPN